MARSGQKGCSAAGLTAAARAAILRRPCPHPERPAPAGPAVPETRLPQAAGPLAAGLACSGAVHARAAPLGQRHDAVRLSPGRAPLPRAWAGTSSSGGWTSRPAIALIAEADPRDAGRLARGHPAAARARRRRSCVLAAALFARELGGGRRAQALAALAVLASPLFLRSANLFQPVVFDQLAWTAALLRWSGSAGRPGPRAGGSGSGSRSGSAC